jgi:hypothetical protein
VPGFEGNGSQLEAIRELTRICRDKIVICRSSSLWVSFVLAQVVRELYLDSNWEVISRAEMKHWGSLHAPDRVFVIDDQLEESLTTVANSVIVIDTIDDRALPSQSKVVTLSSDYGVREV